MIYTPPWLEIAMADARRGVLEQPGPNQNHPRILEFHSHTSLHATTDEVPWCSSAMCAWFEECDPPRESPKSARARAWLNWGIQLSDPAYGAVAVLTRSGRSRQPGPGVIDAPGHVGLLLAIVGTDELFVLAGNTQDRVCIRPYKSDRLLGWRWPAPIQTEQGE